MKRGALDASRDITILLKQLIRFDPARVGEGVRRFVAVQQFS
jgi:hypothetical protein